MSRLGSRDEVIAAVLILGTSASAFTWLLLDRSTPADRLSSVPATPNLATSDIWSKQAVPIETVSQPPQFGVHVTPAEAAASDQDVISPPLDPSTRPPMVDEKAQVSESPIPDCLTTPENPADDGKEPRIEEATDELAQAQNDTELSQDAPKSPPLARVPLIVGTWTKEYRGAVTGIYKFRADGTYVLYEIQTGWKMFVGYCATRQTHSGRYRLNDAVNPWELALLSDEGAKSEISLQSADTDRLEVIGDDKTDVFVRSPNWVCATDPSPTRDTFDGNSSPVCGDWIVPAAPQLGHTATAALSFRNDGTAVLAESWLYRGRSVNMSGTYQVRYDTLPFEVDITLSSGDRIEGTFAFFTDKISIFRLSSPNQPRDADASERGSPFIRMHE